MGQQVPSVVLVTGAGGGMGRVHVRTLAARGWIVGACDVDGESAEDAAAGALSNGDRAFAFQLDIRDEAAVSSVVAELRAHGELSALVNDAGIGSPPSHLDQLSVAQFRQMYEVHVEGAVNCMKAVIPNMSERGYGRIVNIASYCVTKGSPGYSHYSAAKAALVGLTKSVALEVAASGITVNAVAPGLIDTPMTAGDSAERRRHNEAAIPLGRYGRPEEVTGLVVYLLSEEAGYLTGQSIHVNGGMVLAG